MIHYVTSDGIGQPWVGNELRVVTAADVPVVLHAMRAPKITHFDSAWAQRMAASTRVIYPLSPWRMAASIVAAPLFFGARWAAALCNALVAPRENVRARLSALAHFFVACHWARSLRRQPVSHIHSQWAYSSGSIGMYGAWLLGVSFSFTGHATDLFRDRVALRDKIRKARFIICISEFHRDFFLKEGAAPEQLRLAYCGIDVERMAPPPGPRPAGPFTILSAGRLVEKKGFGHLIDACALLHKRGREFRCLIAGSGPLEGDLRRRVSEHDLDGRVCISGVPLAQEAIPAFMHSGDMFVLACVRASDGDVDGLPQLTMEAMGCGLPAVTTRLVGNPDLVVDGATGLLVQPGDASQLADAIGRLMDDPVLRGWLARAGREHVCRRFDIRTCLQPLIEEFRARLKPSSNVPEHAVTGAAA